MNKYIVKNCPAGQIVTSAINPNMAGDTLYKKTRTDFFATKYKKRYYH